jgi:hypothetical protein
MSVERPYHAGMKSDQTGVPAHTDVEKPQVVEEGETETTEEDGTYVTEPSKLIRIASMTRAMLEEVREAPLDDAGRQRLLAIYHRSIGALRDVLSADLREELDTIFLPLEREIPSESELRVAQAQLVGWLEGLFHGIQASLFSQQASAAAQLEQMRRRRALEPSGEEDHPGLYL